MKVNRAFIIVSLFSYFGCLFLTLIGRPPLPNFPVLHQLLGYSVAVLILILRIKTKNVFIKNFSGASYGFAAMITFAGNIQWVGGLGADLAMAAWDLILGIALLLDDGNDKVD